MTIHVVTYGESISSVAAQYNVDPAIVRSVNGLAEDSTLVTGQTLVIRFPVQTHVVEAGESVYSIARDYGIEVLELYRNNYILGGKSELVPGQLLVIAFDDQPLRAIGTNGYAYPYINVRQLDSALPSLTYLTPFTYGITAEGGLVPLNDAELLASAGFYRTAAFMHLSTLTESGQFSNERSSLLFSSEELQENLIRNVIQTMRRKNYYGLDIDFEYVYPEEREAYAAFVTKVRERLNGLGYPVLVALAPKTSDEQKGLLYEAHDYALLGEAANAVLLMTYEWGYTYGPPMAVAPLPQVRAVLDYAVTRIPREKIFLGVPIYGYDWVLPYEQGVTKAESLSPLQAVALAGQYGVAIEYDETAQSPHFSYTGRSGRQHEVWFEDARSIEQKLLLVNEYGLQGIGYWSLMRPFPQNWAVLNSLYDVETLF